MAIGREQIHQGCAEIAEVGAEAVRVLEGDERGGAAGGGLAEREGHRTGIPTPTAG